MLHLLPASIDIGSHSTLLLIADWDQVGGKARLMPKVQKVEVVRLGEDLHSTGTISPERIAELVSVLTTFRQTAHALGARIDRVVMTEAVRKAGNQAEVLEAVEKALWIKPEILAGEDEARLSWAAVAHWHGSEQLTIDVGGGSTELSQGRTFLSIPIGALRLKNEMGVIPGPEYKKWSKETFAGLELKPYAKMPVTLVGGTAVALGMLHLGLSKFDGSILEGLELSMEELDKVITRISDLSKELRTQLPGLENGRSEVIICGLFWIRSLLEKLKAERFRISTLGLRFGVLLTPEVLQELFPEPKAEAVKKRRGF
jgi:exopolyphosphatase/guanosine-5'-triphosphate,3'-diphosphate pyrophosphatase